VYAKRIADRLGWQWKHYTVNAKEFLNNIEEAAIHGCQYSPLHLHAIPQIRNDNEWEVILGGSYGDSIGRAEYGSVNIKSVKPLSNGFYNVASLMKDEVYEKYFPQVEQDLNQYHFLFPRPEIYMQNELDYQLHYMRKMLNPCMELLTENAEFYQVFTHPSTYGFMWSLSPESRNDIVYKEMMKHFPTALNDIPWARTGLLYGETEGKPDQWKNRHHNYVHIIQQEILDQIKKLVLSNEVDELGIFNKEAIRTLVNLVETKPYNSMYYLEQLCWLASVGKMLRLYTFSNSEHNIAASTGEIKKRVLKEYLPRYYRNRLGHYLRKFNLLK
jgi:asparagine synthase (glutamine-hydrolysing)